MRTVSAWKDSYCLQMFTFPFPSQLLGTVYLVQAALFFRRFGQCLLMAMISTHWMLNLLRMMFSSN